MKRYIIVFLLFSTIAFSEQVDFSAINYSRIGTEMENMLTDCSEADINRYQRAGTPIEGMHYTAVMWQAPGSHGRFWLKLFSDTSYVFHTVSKFSPVSIHIQEIGGQTWTFPTRKVFSSIRFTPPRTGDYYYYVANRTNTYAIHTSHFFYIQKRDRSNVRDYTEIILEHMDKRDGITR